MKIREFLFVLFLCSFAVSCFSGCSGSGSSYDDSGLLQPNTNPLVYDMKVNELMADSVEIERKWLIDPSKIPYDLTNAEVYDIEQTYINFSPEIRVHRINNSYFTSAMKANMSSDGMTRDELEIDITEEEYNELYKKREGNTILKTRYQFLSQDGYLMAIDIFHGDLDGLAYLEIEFVSEAESKAYKEPDWVLLDVTADVNYKNGYLARYGIPESFYSLKK